MKSKYPLLILLLLPVFLSAQKDSTATKQDSTDFKYKYYLSSGIYFPDVNTELRLDTKVGIGTVLSLENSFNFPEKPILFRADGDFRITKRSSFSAQFFLMNRSSEQVMEHDIQIREDTIKIGATLKSKVNNTFYGITYRYDVFRRPNLNAGLGVGLRLTLFDMAFSFKRLNGEEKSVTANLPVPVILIGLHASGYFIPRLRGGYRFDFFRLNINGVKGSVYENKFLLEYYFIKNLSLGIASNIIVYNVDDFPVSKNFTGKIIFQISGMEAYLSARF